MRSGSSAAGAVVASASSVVSAARASSLTPGTSHLISHPMLRPALGRHVEGPLGWFTQRATGSRTAPMRRCRAWPKCDSGGFNLWFRAASPFLTSKKARLLFGSPAPARRRNRFNERSGVCRRSCSSVRLP